LIIVAVQLAHRTAICKTVGLAFRRRTHQQTNSRPTTFPAGSRIPRRARPHGNLQAIQRKSRAFFANALM
jgi:hypothetical protein